MQCNILSYNNHSRAKRAQDKESGRTDVDAITFADQDWYYTHWSAPVPHKAKKGTWLKFNDVETANCNDERYPWPWSSKVPMCHVVLSG
jgi:hypothetical protein